MEGKNIAEFPVQPVPVVSYRSYDPVSVIIYPQHGKEDKIIRYRIGVGKYTGVFRPKNAGNIRRSYKRQYYKQYLICTLVSKVFLYTGQCITLPQL